MISPLLILTFDSVEQELARLDRPLGHIRIGQDPMESAEFGLNWQLGECHVKVPESIETDGASGAIIDVEHLNLVADRAHDAATVPKSIRVHG